MSKRPSDPPVFETLADGFLLAASAAVMPVARFAEEQCERDPEIARRREAVQILIESAYAARSLPALQQALEYYFAFFRLCVVGAVLERVEQTRCFPSDMGLEPEELERWLGMKLIADRETS